MTDVTPMDSVIRDKWHAGIDAAGLKTLTGISTQINSIYQAARAEVARAAIEMGRLLIDARELFAGDQQFGVWCAEQFPWANRTTLYNMRILAQQAGDGRITTKVINTLPLGTLFELLPASDVVRDRVEEAVENGQKPTVAAVRAMKKDERSGRGIPGPSGAAPEADGDAPDPDPVSTPRPPATARPEAPETGNTTYTMKPPPKPLSMAKTMRDLQAIMDMPNLDRYRYLMRASTEPTLEQAYMLFGLDPNPCCYPSPFLVDDVRELWLKRATGDAEMTRYIHRCVELVEADRRGFHD